MKRKDVPMKLLIPALCLLSLCAGGCSSRRAPRGVLMVVSNVTRIPDSTLETGVWAEEFVVPYTRFREAGIPVTLASPTGGPVVFDKGSCDPNVVTDPELLAQLRSFMKNQGELLARTVPLSRVRSRTHEALFVPGGHGVMFDLATNEKLARITESYLRRGKPVATVCHGPCFLARARDRAGRPLIDGYRVTGFSNTEEKAVNMNDHMPFSLEDELRRASGGLYESGAPWGSHVVQDRNLVTGQNPASSEAAAMKLIGLIRSKDGNSKR